MPELNTSLHLDMLQQYKKRHTLLRRIKRAMREVVSPDDFYGRQWGDPDIAEPQKFVRDRFVMPFIKAEQTGLEIGPGGGRWTKYLLGFKKVYIVDYHAELIQEVRARFNKSHMQFIVNNGTDFPGVPSSSVDYVFSFACFVHLELHLIQGYLTNLATILKPGGNAVISYADNNKIAAKCNPGFSQNNPEIMRRMVSEAGFRIEDEDVTSLWNSSVVRFSRP